MTLYEKEERGKVSSLWYSRIMITHLCWRYLSCLRAEDQGIERGFTDVHVSQVQT
mgnify:CR=1 FL=1